MTLVVDVKYILLSFCRYNSNAQTKVYKMLQATLIFYYRNITFDQFMINKIFMEY